MLIQDDWYRVEWQVRGDLLDQGAKFSWNFHIGSKFNANPYITDVVYLGLQRDDLDFRKPFLSWLDNSSADFQLEFSQHGGHVVREEFVVGKKYPFPAAGYAITLSVGLVWDGVGEYSGHAALAANQTNGHCQSSYRGKPSAPAFVAISRRFRQRTPITRR